MLFLVFGPELVKGRERMVRLPSAVVLADAGRGRPMSVSSPERRAFLDEMPHAILATNRQDAQPQVSPVWYLWSDGRIVISTDVTTAKVANIRRDPRVSVCIDDPQTGRYVAVSGRAEVIEGDDVRGPTLELIRKYREEPDVLPHWERISSLKPRVLVVVEPHHFFWRGM